MPRYWTGKHHLARALPAYCWADNEIQAVEALTAYAILLDIRVYADTFRHLHEAHSQALYDKGRGIEPDFRVKKDA